MIFRRVTIISIATLTTVVCLQVNVIIAISVTYLLFFLWKFQLLCCLRPQSLRFKLIVAGVKYDRLTRIGMGHFDHLPRTLSLVDMLGDPLPKDTTE